MRLIKLNEKETPVYDRIVEDLNRKLQKIRVSNPSINDWISEQEDSDDMDYTLDYVWNDYKKNERKFIEYGKRKKSGEIILEIHRAFDKIGIENFLTSYFQNYMIDIYKPKIIYEDVTIKYHAKYEYNVEDAKL